MSGIKSEDAKEAPAANAVPESAIEAPESRAPSSNSNSSLNSEQPPAKKMKLVPNIAEELAKNRSPPLSKSHNNIKKQISISSLLSDPQPPKPIIRSPTVILPSQRPGTSNISESSKNDILIARTNSPVNVQLDRSQSSLQSSSDSGDKDKILNKLAPNIDAVLSSRPGSEAGSDSQQAQQPQSVAKTATNTTNDTNSASGNEVKATSNSKSSTTTDQKSKAKVKEETPSKATKQGSKNGKGSASKSNKNSKATAKGKKDSKAKPEAKNKNDPKVKSESPKPNSESSSETPNNNTPEVVTNDSKVKSETTDSETAESKKEKSKKKKTETPRKLVPAPPIKSPKLSSVEVDGKPIVILDIPLHDVSSNEYLDENGQVVFNVYNMIQEKYGGQISKTKRNLIVDLNDDVEAAEDNEGEDGAEVEHDAEDDDDDDDDDDEEDDEEDGAAIDSTKNKDSSSSPKKKRPHPLKGKSRIGKYDIEDPFIDDSELLWEEQRAATRDGFFVYFGPLIEKGQYASFQRVDGTMKKGGIKNPK